MPRQGVTPAANAGKHGVQLVHSQYTAVTMVLLVCEHEGGGGGGQKSTHSRRQLR
jgi:hypothetical protein